MAKPIVSLLILNWNGKELIRDMLNSLRKNKFGVPYEVIVIDNASKDGSQEFIEKNYPEVKQLYMEKNLGTGAFNYALPYCKGKYVIQLGNDMKFTNDSFRNAIKILEKDKTIAAVIPKLINLYNKKQIDFGGEWVSRTLYCGMINTIKESNREKEILGCGCGVMKKDIIKKIGGIYDPDFFLYGEDIDLGLRIRLAGYRCIYSPDSVMYHAHATTNTVAYPKPRLIYLTERNLLVAALKNYSIKSLIIYFPYIVLTRILAILKDLFLFRFKNAFARIRGISWALFHPIALLKRRKITQKIRKKSDKYVFALFNEKKFFSSIFR